MIAATAVLQWRIVLERSWAAAWAWYKFVEYGGGGHTSPSPPATLPAHAAEKPPARQTRPRSCTRRVPHLACSTPQAPASVRFSCPQSASYPFWFGPPLHP